MGGDEGISSPISMPSSGRPPACSPACSGCERELWSWVGWLWLGWSGSVSERTMTEDGWISPSGLTIGVSILDPFPGIGSRVWACDLALLEEASISCDRVYRLYSRRVSEGSCTSPGVNPDLCAQSGSQSGL